MRHSFESSCLETLERRRLFIAIGPFSYTIVENQLRVYGTSQNDDIVIAYNASTKVHTLKVSNASNPPVTKTVNESGNPIKYYSVGGRGESASGGDKLTMDNTLDYPTVDTVENVVVLAAQQPDGLKPSDYDAQFASRFSPSAPEVTEINKLHATNSQYDTWFFGDSFAEKFKDDTYGLKSWGGGSNDADSDPNNNSDHWNTHTINLGFSGYTTRQLTSVIQGTDVFASSKLKNLPKDVFILAGTNDFRGDITPPATSGSDSQIAFAVEDLATQLKIKISNKFGASAASQVNFHILDVSPERQAGANYRLLRVHDYMAADAARSGATFTFVDLYDEFVKKGNVGVNSLYFQAPGNDHLSELGYSEVSQAFLDDLT